MQTIRAVRYHSTGVPSEVVRVDEVPSVAPGAGEVAVRMEWAPVNPADLNMLEGKYGEARPLPDVPGNEGCGRVTAVGSGVDESWIGRLVLVDSEAWREEGNWPVAGLVPVPLGLDSRRAQPERSGDGPKAKVPPYPDRGVRSVAGWFRLHPCRRSGRCGIILRGCPPR
jgi:hypothetical protein